MDAPFKAAILDGDWIMFQGLLAFADRESLDLAIQNGQSQMVEEILQVLTKKRPLDLSEELTWAVNQWYRHDQLVILEMVRILLFYTVPIDVRDHMCRVGEEDIVELFELFYAYERDYPPSPQQAKVIVGPRCCQFLFEQSETSEDFCRFQEELEDIDSV